MNHRIAIALLSVLLSVFPGIGRADLLQYIYTDSQGNVHTRKPSENLDGFSSVNVIQASGDIRFFLNGGLERKVKIEVINTEGGQLIAEKKSHVLGSSDRIQVDGKEYFGTELSLPLAPGYYKLVASWETSTGYRAGEKEYLVKSARTMRPPLAQIQFTSPSEVFTPIIGGGHTLSFITRNGNYDIPGHYYRPSIRKYRYQIKYADGPNEGKVVASGERDAYIDASQSETIMSTNVSEALFPEERRKYVVALDVEDAIGQIGSTEVTVDYNDSCGTLPEPVGVVTINSKGKTIVTAWSEGGEISSDPVTLRWRLPRQNWSEEDPYGIVAPPPSKTDADYVYVDIATSLTPDPAEGFRSTNGKVCRAYTDFTFVKGEELLPNYTMTGGNVGLYDSWIFGTTWSGGPIATLRNGRATPAKLSISMDKTSHERTVFVKMDTGYAKCSVGILKSGCIIDDSRFAWVDSWAESGEKVWPVYIVSGEPNSFSLVTGRATNPVGEFRLSWGEQDTETEAETMVGFADRQLLYGDNAPREVRVVVTGPLFRSASASLKIGNGTLWDETKTHALSPIGEEEMADAKYFRFDVSGEPTGQMWLKPVATLETGQTIEAGLESVYSDFSPPTVEILGRDKPLDGGSIRSSDDIRIHVSDSYETAHSWNKATKVESITLKGGPENENVELAWRSEDDGVHLEYPVLIPSLSDEDAYELIVVANDGEGNIHTETARFSYKPHDVPVDGEETEYTDIPLTSMGLVYLPAVDHTFKHANGHNLIHTEPLTRDGAIVVGQYHVYATIAAGATTSLKVNGVRVDPGQTKVVASNYDFGAAEGVLSLPVVPADAGVVGEAALMVSTAAPNGPIVKGTVKTWTAKASLTAGSWSIRQLVDPIEVSITAASKSGCRFTGDETEAKTADLLQDPVCYVSWTAIPDEASILGSATTGGLPRVGGWAVAPGEQDIAYEVYVYDGDGTRVKVASGKRALTVTELMGTVSYAPTEDVATVYQVVQDIQFGIRQTKGPECSEITLDSQRAINLSAQGQNACFFEWSEVPSGLVQEATRNKPTLAGRLPAGTHPLKWRVSMYSQRGTRVLAAEETFNIEAVDPPAPQISFANKNLLKDNLYTITTDGGEVTKATVTAFNAPLRVAVLRDGEVLGEEVFEAGWQSEQSIERTIKAINDSLWTKRTYTVRATFEELPTVTGSAEMVTLAVPADNIQAVIETDLNEVVSTDTLPVTVRVGNSLNDMAHDASLAGEWDVTVLSYKSRTFGEPVSDAAATQGGIAAFAIDLSDSPENSQLSARATIASPGGEYSKTLDARRPISVTVLSGKPVSGNLVAGRVTGEVPMTAMIRLQIPDYRDERALGEVKWQISRDGQRWEPFEGSLRRPTRFVNIFGEAGQYWVRAELTNRNSGLVSQTAAVQFHTYHVPIVSLEGPATVFVGGQGKYSVLAKDRSGNSVPAKDLVIEWSTDRGETWAAGEATYVIAKDAPERLRLEVRARYTTSPSDDEKAYKERKQSVAFVEPRSPRVRVSGPRRAEVGTENVFTAKVSAPYSNMDVTFGGKFTLPDGTEVEGTELTYVPTERDLALERVEIVYTGWVEGFAGTEKASSQKVKIWKYIWPEFSLSERTSARYAPADVELKVRQNVQGELEEPTYTWAVAQNGVKVTTAEQEVHKLVVEEPGTYTFGVTIRDKRGNEALVEQTLEFLPADPYVLKLSYEADNEYGRAPLGVAVRPAITGGHPDDRITSITYTVGGKVYEAEGRYGRFTLQEGLHPIDVAIQSEMGKTVTGSVEVKVVPNTPPVCELDASEGSSSFVFTALCTDPDGKMQEYHWTVDGEPISLSGRRITVSKYNRTSKPAIGLVGIDDSAASSSVVNW